MLKFLKYSIFAISLLLAFIIGMKFASKTPETESSKVEFKETISEEETTLSIEKPETEIPLEEIMMETETPETPTPTTPTETQIPESIEPTESLEIETLEPLELTPSEIEQTSPAPEPEELQSPELSKDIDINVPLTPPETPTEEVIETETSPVPETPTPELEITIEEEQIPEQVITPEETQVIPVEEIMEEPTP